ncbi:DUF6037 family protein [Leuconostoc gelidum]|uniref:DUF6037 family protein n=1 Tax=Leuconostoc gelidum TaxID=1244 RepID=UPI001C7CA9E1|nr:DUF6037 family protein [Leuconostoc gelidum]MBZ6009767.1 hypothetical protein [Leuconostoc gelidum subsp. aenigmaticum]
MSNTPFEFYRLKREWRKEQLNTLFMDFRYNNIDFTVIFSTEKSSLLLLKKGANQIQAELDLPLIDGFRINTFVKGLYYSLVNFLEIQYDPVNKFRPFNFFKLFDDKFKLRQHAKNEEIQYLTHTHHLEDPDAVYFLRLIPHESKNNGHVTGANLEKTKWLLPKFYAKHSKDDISVAYTADKHKERTIPQEYR